MSPDKGGMAEEEKGHRVYRETYGRGGGASFQDQDYPQSYGRSGATDWRRALRVYVNGHDRGWETERKEREAAEAASGTEPASPTGRELEPAGTAATSPEETGGAPDEATARTEEGTRFGVPVPDRHELRFHRGASVWRDRLPDASRLPRHTDRRLDTSPGRGGQA